LFALLLALMLLGIGGVAVTAQPVTQPAVPDGPQANPIINIAHFAPIGATLTDTLVVIDVSAFGFPLTTTPPIPYGARLAGLNQLPAGSYEVNIKSALNGASLMSATVAVANDTEYTLIATGDGAAYTPTLLVKTDVVTTAIGFATLRIGHLAPFLPFVNLTAVDICQDGPLGRTLLAPNVTFGTVADLDVAAGFFDYSVAAPATNCGTILFDAQPIWLFAGKFYDVLAVGKNLDLTGTVCLCDDPFLVTLTSIRTLNIPPQLSLGHVAPFAETVTDTLVDIDVYMANPPLGLLQTITNVTYGAIQSTYARLPLGVYTVSLSSALTTTLTAEAAESSDVLFASDPITLTPAMIDRRFTVLATGDTANQPLALQIFEDIFTPLTATAPVIQYMHVAPFAGGAATVELCDTATGEPVAGAPALSYGERFETTLPPAFYQFYLSVDGCATSVLTLPVFLSRPDTTFFFYIIGDGTAAFPLDVISFPAKPVNLHLPLGILAAPVEAP
jgi:hypothetical protein